MKRIVFVLVFSGVVTFCFAQTNTAWSTTGSIGIGTTTPSSPLEVVGNITGTGIVGQTLWTGDGTQGVIRKLTANTPLRFLNSSGSEEMRISDNGYVGIGTTTPSSALEVVGNISGTAIIGQTLWTGDGTQGTIRKLSAYTPLKFLKSDGNEEMRIAANGYVGIGTTTPSSPLEVVGNISGTGIIGQTLWTGDGTQGTIRKLTANTPLKFLNSDGNEEMRVDFNGNVGVGTTTPDSKLTVAGKIHSQEVKVTTTAGADFVFEENYKLRPLLEIENFIKDNKHLPEIASADDMKKNGIQLGEMNIKLLQKIEELTIYLIEKEKQVTDLQQRVKKLESK